MIRFPEPFRALLANSPQEAGVLELQARVDQVLADNKTPFFPDYTDHGADHVSRVAEAAARLVPQGVWERGLLGSTDIAVLCGAILLHDLAMHIREAGFLDLVEGDHYVPLLWFNEEHGARAPDRPWRQMWKSFRAEARHLSSADLDVILGPHNRGVPRVAYEDEEYTVSDWTTADRLLIGEFLRRHHARLSHEIARYGFPGARDHFGPPDVLGVATDAMGIVARSHGESLRSVAVDYLEWYSPGNKRPYGALLPYLMGLLRIADYLQIEASRAPSLLFRLRKPQSRASIDEWNKHGSVAVVSWDVADPLALYVETSVSQSLRTHLQLRELLADLEVELDTTSAVLSELYPSSPLSELRLSRQRVRSNLYERSLYDRLEFAPRPARLRSGEDLFRLLVRPLYGDHPSVGGRELLQNAVDAVRELRRWEAATGDVVDAAEMRPQSADVEVTVHDKGNGRGVLCIADRGIGMTPDVVADFFMTAGASFGPSPHALEDVDSADAVKWMKAGRFGIGAFAAFLIGEPLRVATRHPSQARGVVFEAAMTSDVVELRWTSMPIGTSVEVEFSFERLAELFWSPSGFPGSLFRQIAHDSVSVGTRLLREVENYYVMQEPTAHFQVVSAAGEVEQVPRDAFVPAREASDDLEHWRSIRPEGLDGVLWTHRSAPLRGEFRTDTNVAHNGLELRPPYTSLPPGAQSSEEVGYAWSRPLANRVATPYVAIFDSRHQVSLDLTRYGLQARVLPFESDLAYSVGLDVVAHALVRGVALHPLHTRYGLAPVFNEHAWFPLLPALTRRYLPEDGGLIVIWEGGSSAPTTVRAPEIARGVLAQLGSTESVACLTVQRGAALTSSDLADLARAAGLQLVVRVLDAAGKVRIDSLDRGGKSGLLVRAARAAAELATTGRTRRTLSDVMASRNVDARPRTSSPLTKAGIGVACFANREASRSRDAADNSVSAAWHALVGGPLPRPSDQRERLTEELIETHPELLSYVRRWQRLTRQQSG
jgi:hypothetical protein